MYRAKDLTKDQSYFLFNTTQEQLNFLRFPLGTKNKEETRKIALELKLNVADKPDSQDICFVPNGNYASVIKKYRPESFQKGNILDTKGNILGQHEGIINFTIGQRKGIKIANGAKLYGYRDSHLAEFNLKNIELLIKKDLLENNLIKPVYLS